MTDAVVNVASVLHCAAHTNLTMTEANVVRLVFELTGRLNSLVRELSTAVSSLDPLDLCARQLVHLPGLKGDHFSSPLQNFSEVASDIRQIFTEEGPPTLPQEHLNDPGFIALWFKVKLLPLLPAVPVQILSCLSTKNFTCPVFHTM